MRLTRVARWFSRCNVADTARTTMFFPHRRADVWDAMMFYEEVPDRPALLLRLFLPRPLRTRGDKREVGARIDCAYEGGTLAKEMTLVEAPRAIAFDVRAQALGIEDAITMSGGSYELTEEAGGTRVTLTTSYFGHLRPRWLFRRIEHFLARRLHRHILSGMREALAARRPSPAAEHPPRRVA